MGNRRTEDILIGDWPGRCDQLFENITKLCFEPEVSECRWRERVAMVFAKGTVISLKVTWLMGDLAEVLVAIRWENGV